MSKQKRGFTVLYIPNKQGKRSVQIHLSYLMSALLFTIISSSFVGVFFLVWESTQMPNTEELLSETLEISQNKTIFEEELHSLERRIALLEIYALQGEEEGGPLTIVHQNIDTILPWTPFLLPPVQSPMRTKLYGIHGLDAHQGIDFFAPKGMLVQASSGGFVRSVVNDDAYGTMIVIQESSTIETLYAHLSDSFVQEGDWVTSASPIGLVGDSGDASGYHVHFELLFEGIPIDPSPYLLEP